jgi:hypothetical protein
MSTRWEVRGPGDVEASKPDQVWLLSSALVPYPSTINGGWRTSCRAFVNAITDNPVVPGEQMRTLASDAYHPLRYPPSGP